MGACIVLRKGLPYQDTFITLKEDIMNTDKIKIYEDMKKLSYPRIFKNQKKPGLTYIKEQLEGIYDLQVVNRKILYKGFIPTTCRNLESTNEEYDVVLTAHYDTPPIRESYLLSHLSRNTQMIQNRLLRYMATFLYLIVFAGAILFLSYSIEDILFSLIHRMDFYLGKGVFFIRLISIFLSMNIFVRIWPKGPYVADDNTSGVVGLIYLAKTLNETEYKDRVKLVFTDKEELGLLGAKAFEKENREKIKDKMFINFDCIGRGSNLLITSPNNTEIAKEIHAFLKDKGINTRLYPASFSDDRAFTSKKLKAVGFIRADLNHFGTKQITWTHTKHDTIENISADRIIETITAAMDFIEEYIKNKCMATE